MDVVHYESVFSSSHSSFMACVASGTTGKPKVSGLSFLALLWVPFVCILALTIDLTNNTFQYYFINALSDLGCRAASQVLMCSQI